MSLKTPVYEAVEVGEEFGPIELLVDDHAIKSFAFAMDDYNPWYFGGATPFGCRVAPPALVAKHLLVVFLSKYDPNLVVGLHQKEEIWCHRPVPCGSRLTLSGKYVNKYVKRGKGYVVLEAEARDEHGRVLVRQRSTEVMRIPDGIKVGARSAEPPARQVQGVWPADRKPVAMASRDVVQGTPLPPMVKQVHQDQMSVFSGADWHWHNIHTDIRIAQGAGFGKCITQGMMEACWLSEMMGSFFGPSWYTTGWLSTVFLSPVFAGDTLTFKAVVTDLKEEAEGLKVELEVWCENQKGVMTAGGWASAIVGQ